MIVRVLGSAAGGGFPQWNCGCANCLDFRKGVFDGPARTQASVAVSADGRDWFLLNASPDVRAQIEFSSVLHPRAPRDTPIAGIILTNGDIDACLGLFVLRESQPLHVYATNQVANGLFERNVLVRTLQRTATQLTFHALTDGVPVPLCGPDGNCGLTVEAKSMPGKVPIHLQDCVTPTDGDNVGLIVRDTHKNKSLAYLPSVAHWTPTLESIADTVDCIFMDGTFFQETELPAQGLGMHNASVMSHWPVGGESGSLRWLANRSCPRKIFTHVNNTNPILRENSPERAQLVACGIAVAYDGLEIRL